MKGEGSDVKWTFQEAPSADLIGDADGRRHHMQASTFQHKRRHNKRFGKQHGINGIYQLPPLCREYSWLAMC
jgi:hypothetical protein